MSRALIGHTGFVGSNVASQTEFDAFFNSENFRDMTGQCFEQIVCAGVSAVKWIANKEPEKDRVGIRALEEVLATVSADRFTLISTIDVYPMFESADESYDCGSRNNHAYGMHRLAFERFCYERFSDCLIVRLPGLFGQGLKKNVIFDLLNDNCLDMINPACSIQYYDLSRLWLDIEKASSHGVDVINLFPEPITTQAILDRFFREKEVGKTPGGEVHYDLRTRHAHLWGRSDGYIAGKVEVMDAMGRFIESYERATS